MQNNVFWSHKRYLEEQLVQLLQAAPVLTPNINACVRYTLGFTKIGLNGFFLKQIHYKQPGQVVGLDTEPN